MAATGNRTAHAGIELELEGSIETPPMRHRPLVGSLLLAAGVVLTALNLRAAVTAVSSVLGDMRGSLGASTTWASLVTTVPTLCFAAAGVAAPWLGRRLGVARAIGAGLALMVAGQLLRVLDGPFVVLAGTLVACAGIAMSNVLIPVVVKESFVARIGLMTGVYTAALQGSGSLGSSLTPWLDNALGGWRPGLAVWAGLAALALAVWTAGARHGTEVSGGPERDAPRRSFLRVPLAWVITGFFGLQSLSAYVILGWTPQVWITAGLSQEAAGLMLGLVTVIAVPVSLIVPPLAARSRSQSGWIAGLTVAGMFGMLGMMLAPATLPWLWAVLLGLSSSVFSLLLTILPLRTRTSADTARVSAMAQGFGYLLASIGPFLFGMLHEATGGWTVSFVMVLAVMAVQVVLGALAGRPRFV